MVEGSTLKKTWMLTLLFGRTVPISKTQRCPVFGTASLSRCQQIPSSNGYSYTHKALLNGGSFLHLASPENLTYDRVIPVKDTILLEGAAVLSMRFDGQSAALASVQVGRLVVAWIT